MTGNGKDAAFQEMPSDAEVGIDAASDAESQGYGAAGSGRAVQSDDEPASPAHDVVPTPFFFRDCRSLGL